MIEETNDLKIVLDFILEFGAEGSLPCPDEGGSGDLVFEAAVRFKTKKLKQVLESLTHLYGVAAELDSDCASAINSAEDTVQKTIAFYEDKALVRRESA